MGIPTVERKRALQFSLQLSNYQKPFFPTKVILRILLFFSLPIPLISRSNNCILFMVFILGHFCEINLFVYLHKNLTCLILKTAGSKLSLTRLALVVLLHGSNFKSHTLLHLRIASSGTILETITKNFLRIVI